MITLLFITTTLSIDINTKYNNLLLNPQIELSDIHKSQLYNHFLMQYDKQYTQEKFTNFKNSLTRIISNNSKPSTYKKGINEYSDLSDEEFNKLFVSEPQNCSATNQTSQRALLASNGLY